MIKSGNEAWERGLGTRPGNEAWELRGLSDHKVGCMLMGLGTSKEAVVQTIL